MKPKDFKLMQTYIFAYILLFVWIGKLSAVSHSFTIPEKLNSLNQIQKYGTKGSYRVGLSTGVNLYVGNQMDYQITRNFGVINEAKLGYGLGAYTTLNNNWEFGTTIKHGSFSTLKSNNTQGILGNFNEVQFNFQKSLNNNILLDEAALSANLQFGIGLIHFQSQYFYIDPRKQTITQIASSVGYGYSGEGQFRAAKYKNIPDKQFAFLGNVGFNLGYRLSGNIIFYWENILSLSSTSNLSGNLITTTRFPTDAMFYSGISLYANLGKKVGSFGRNSCPRWF